MEPFSTQLLPPSARRIGRRGEIREVMGGVGAGGDVWMTVCECALAGASYKT